MNKDKILIADDDPDVISALQYLLETEGYQVSVANSPNEALKQVKTTVFNLLLMDLNYAKDTTSGKEGFALLREVKRSDPNLPVVAMTAWGSIETAVTAMQKGARDFVTKPWENDRLLSVLSNQILLRKSQQQSQKLEAENLLLRRQLDGASGLLISRSQTMNALLSQMQQVARSDASILLTGENGTGKSYLVQHIHQLSPRGNQSLISVNMGSISESLFESEMFGHVKGAFTDARENRIGRFELADGGTLFLDEIGNTPYSQQAKLLRVLEDQEFEKVGSSRTQQSNCRLICATNSVLETAVASGEFRKDLLYRINTVTIEVPALRKRREDIIPLANYFLQLHAVKYVHGKPANGQNLTLSNDAKQTLQNYHWPGNIRELSHVIERAVILCSGETISATDLGIEVSQNDSSESSLFLTANANTLDDIEKRVISTRLTEYNGNSIKAAKSLGLSKSAFYRHLRKHGL